MVGGEVENKANSAEIFDTLSHSEWDIRYVPRIFIYNCFQLMDKPVKQTNIDFNIQTQQTVC